MRNFETKKLLSNCNVETELSIGTAFELTIDGVPVRRGVICKSSPTLAWFLSKSAKPDNLFALDEDFTTEDRGKLFVQGVVKYDDFVRKLPGSVRAHGATHRQKKEGRTHTKTAGSDDFIHPHLATDAMGNARLPNTTRLNTVSPGCSPPLSPRSKSRKTAKVPPKPEVYTLSSRVPSTTRFTDNFPGCTPPTSPRPKKQKASKPTTQSQIQVLQTSLAKISEDIKKIRRCLKKQSQANRPVQASSIHLPTSIN